MHRGASSLRRAFTSRHRGQGSVRVAPPMDGGSVSGVRLRVAPPMAGLSPGSVSGSRASRAHRLRASRAHRLAPLLCVVRQPQHLAWHAGLRGQARGTCAKRARAHLPLMRRPIMRRRADREVEGPTRPPPSDIWTGAERQASCATRVPSNPGQERAERWHPAAVGHQERRLSSVRDRHSHSPWPQR